MKQLNETIQNCLHLVPDATLANIGTPRTMWMATEAALNQWFQARGGHPATLLPEPVANTPNTIQLSDVQGPPQIKTFGKQMGGGVYKYIIGK